MKRTYPHALAGLCCLLLAAPPAAWADGVAVNSVRGGIRGINNGTLKNGDGTNDARVTIRVKQLKLIKQARALSGKVLTEKDAVARGQRIYFVFVIENDIDSPIEDIRLIDEFPESDFVYVPGTLEEVRLTSTDASIAGGADDAAGVNTNPSGGANQITLKVGRDPNNKSLDIPGKTTWALRFQVKVKGRK
jgi:hypothetical protein